MEDVLWWMFLLFVGGIIGVMGNDFSTFHEMKFYNQHQKLIAECEKSLPRTQTCILVAKPKEGEE